MKPKTIPETKTGPVNKHQCQPEHRARFRRHPLTRTRVPGQRRRRSRGTYRQFGVHFTLTAVTEEAMLRNRGSLRHFSLTLGQTVTSVLPLAEREGPPLPRHATQSRCNSENCRVQNEPSRQSYRNESGWR